MGHVKRSANRKTEVPSKENVNDRVTNKNLDKKKGTESAESCGSRQLPNGASPHVKQFAKDFHVFCAARRYYTPDVERLFWQLDESVRQGASTREILEQLESILDAMVSSSLENDRRSSQYRHRVKRFFARFRRTT